MVTDVRRTDCLAPVVGPSLRWAGSLVHPSYRCFGTIRQAGAKAPSRIRSLRWCYSPIDRLLAVRLPGKRQIQAGQAGRGLEPFRKRFNRVAIGATVFPLLRKTERHEYEMGSPPSFCPRLATSGRRSAC